MTEREKLKEVLDQLFKGRLYPRELADFILEDRKRIVEDFIKYKEEWKSSKFIECADCPWGHYSYHRLIDKALKKAGINEHQEKHDPYDQEID